MPEPSPKIPRSNPSGPLRPTATNRKAPTQAMLRRRQNRSPSMHSWERQCAHQCHCGTLCALLICPHANQRTHFFRTVYVRYRKPLSVVQCASGNCPEFIRALLAVGSALPLLPPAPANPCSVRAGVDPNGGVTRRSPAPTPLHLAARHTEAAAALIAGLCRGYSAPRYCVADALACALSSPLVPAITTFLSQSSSQGAHL